MDSKGKKRLGTLLITPTPNNDEVMDMALELVTVAGEGSGEMLGAISNAVAGAYGLGTGLTLSPKILDGAAIGRGLATMARSIQELGGSRYIRKWLEHVRWAPAGKQEGESVPISEAYDTLSKGTILLAFKLSVVTNCADFFDSSGKQILGPLPGIAKEIASVLKQLPELLKEVKKPV